MKTDYVIVAVICAPTTNSSVSLSRDLFASRETQNREATCSRHPMKAFGIQI
jgi:hypothetical protein